MASVAQVQANRSNAQKSTGPRTPEGKAAASRNAVKHGLSAEQVVIHGEDPEEFDLYRAGMLEELAPVGAVETMLAERAVSLSWRLRRAERLQSAVFATVYRENANDVVLWPKHGLPIQPGPGEDEVVLGQVVMTDFARAQVLDRLLVYERRIESSLYRTMAQLRREREARAAGPEPAAAAKLGSFGADGAAEVSSLKGQVSGGCGCGARFVPRLREGVSSSGCDGRASAPRSTLAATDTSLATATADPAGAGNHGRDARATKTLHEHPCETNPISEGRPAWLGPQRREGSGQSPTAMAGT